MDNMINSQFDFLKEYPELVRYHKHFLRAEEYLYDSPQDSCSQITVFLEGFAKQLCIDNNIQLEPLAGAARAINELCFTRTIDYEFQKYAVPIIANRNNALHENVDSEEKAIESLQNGYLFCRRYIIKYLDPTMIVGYYKVPTREEIRGRKIDGLGIGTTAVLMEQLKSLEIRCESSDEIVKKQTKENTRLKERLEAREKEIKEMVSDTENVSKKHQIMLDEKDQALAVAKNAISEKETLIAEQNRTIGELQMLVSSHNEKEAEYTSQVNNVIASGYDYLNDLNAEQRKAVLETEGYVRVLAGPGTGKTKTLAHRFIHLVVSKKIPPESILCLTFTNKAAREMKTRIGQHLGSCDLSQICTFHSFCYRIISENSEDLGLRSDFVMIDTEDATVIIEDICDKMSIEMSGSYSLKSIKRALRNFKTGKRMLEFRKMMFDKSFKNIETSIHTCSSTMDEICYRFVYEQKASSLLEFDDLIYATGYLFSIKPEIMRNWQNRLKYIMVDEYQDVDPRQAKMCQCLAEINKNLFVVGDPNQTIYSWRFADVRCLKQFPIQDSSKDIVLVENYRSTPEILSISKQLIEKQSSYSFRTQKPSGEKPFIYQAKTTTDEATWIVDKMESLAESGTAKNKIAVLFRSGYMSQKIELELLKRNLPYRVIGGNAFYNSKEIKVIHSYLQLIAYDNDFAFKKVIGKPSRGIGGKTISKLYEIKQERNLSFFEAMRFVLQNEILGVFNTETAIQKAQEFVSFIDCLRQESGEKKLSRIVSDIIEKSGYASLLSDNEDDEGLRNVIQLLSSIQNKESDNDVMGIANYTIHDYLKEIATYSSSDNKADEDSFVLSTIHGSKGLEYQYVILCGLEENEFPTCFKYHTGNITTEVEHLQEERRLCFVALTRATEGVYLTYAISQDNRGEEDRLAPSRFIKEIQGQ